MSSSFVVEAVIELSSIRASDSGNNAAPVDNVNTADLALNENDVRENLLDDKATGRPSPRTRNIVDTVDNEITQEVTYHDNGLQETVIDLGQPTCTDIHTVSVDGGNSAGTSNAASCVETADSAVNENAIRETVVDIASVRPSSTGNNVETIDNGITVTGSVPDIAEAKEQISRPFSRLLCCFKQHSTQMMAEPNDEEIDKKLMKFFDSTLEFPISPTKVEQIKGSVEKVVQMIVQKVWESDKLQLKLQKLNPALSQPRISCVGSMKEGTRNYFPDEFDFLITLDVIDKSLGGTPLVESVLKTFHDELDSVLKRDKHDLFDTCIVFFNKVRISGPASKLLFMYTTSRFSSTWKEIHVDLVPTVQIPICETDATIGDDLGLDTLDPSWRQMVLDTGYYNVILKYERFSKRCCFLCRYPVLLPSITRTEIDFMGTKVSKNHNIAYRFIKHFINGRDVDRLIDKIQREFFDWYDMPSYALKTILYEHVAKCQCDRYVSKCVRKMLIDLSNCITNNGGNMTTILKRNLRLCDGLNRKLVPTEIKRIETSLRTLQYENIESLSHQKQFINYFYLKGFIKSLFVFIVLLVELYCMTIMIFNTFFS